jgi:hypothetical protein
MDVAGKTAHMLARRSSRRQFIRFMGAGSLGVGLWLTRTDVSLGAVSGCVGCGGGPCNPCYSPATLCNNLQGDYPASFARKAAAARTAARPRVSGSAASRTAAGCAAPSATARRAAAIPPATASRSCTSRAGDAVHCDPLPLRVVMPVLALVSLSLLVGLSTAASP